MKLGRHAQHFQHVLQPRVHVTGKQVSAALPRKSKSFWSNGIQIAIGGNCPRVESIGIALVVAWPFPAWQPCAELA